MARHPAGPKERAVCISFRWPIQGNVPHYRSTRSSLLANIRDCLDEAAPMELVSVGRLYSLPDCSCQLLFHICLLFGMGAAFLFFGLKRAYGEPQQYRGRIAGPILSLLSFFALSFFCFLIFYQTRQLPASAGAP